MRYTITRMIADASLEDIEARARATLSEHGFGVLTEIDVTSTLKQKIGAEIGGYRILGACNPQMAHEALEIEPRAGAMLPCNVILREVADGVEVSAIDPVASMQAINNESLKSVASEVRSKLATVVEEI